MLQNKRHTEWEAISVGEQKAVNKKKSVSCPAGGRNCGQTGGRNFFFFFPFYFLLCKEILSFFFEGGEWKNEKKGPSRPLFKHTAASPETDFFFRLAQFLYIQEWNNPGIRQFLKVNLRPFLRRYKTDFSGI